MNADTETTYRIKLYEVIGEGGQYFDITVRAFSTKSAWTKARETYPAYAYRAAKIEIDAG